MKQSLLLFIDTETTGLDPEIHSILQVAWMLESLPERAILDSNNFYIDVAESYWESASAQALETNGLSRKLLHNKKKLNDIPVLLPVKAMRVLVKFFERILEYDTPKSNKYWVGKNPKFDLDFIDEFIGFWPKTGFGHVGNIFNHRLIDINSYLAPLVISDTIRDFNFSSIQLPAEKHHDARGNIINARCIFWNFFYAANTFALTPKTPKED